MNINVSPVINSKQDYVCENKKNTHYLDKNSKLDSFERSNIGVSCDEREIINDLKNKTIDLLKKICSKKQQKLDINIVRQNLSDEEILQNAKELLEVASEKLGIPADKKPEISTDFVFLSDKIGGGYDKAKNIIYLNPQAYRNGTFEIDNIVMHELTHANEAHLRASIPQDRVDEIVKEELISRILYGENEQIIVRNGIKMMGPVMMEPPIMSDCMKQDFVKFAKENLYNKSKKLNDDLIKYSNFKVMEKAYSFNKKFVGEENFQKAKKEIEITLEDLKPITSKIYELINNYPEFMSESSQSDKFNILLEYALSHNERFISFIYNEVGFDNEIPVKPEVLPEEKLQYAEQSLRNMISMWEGNACMSGARSRFATEKTLNQYQFCQEEVLAQINGNMFSIQNALEKLNELRSNGSLTKNDEEFLINKIEKSKIIIEYKSKGLEYYEKYCKMINNPEDELLKKEVKSLKSELDNTKKRAEKYIDIA